MRKTLSVLLLATWALAGLAFAETTPTATPAPAPTPTPAAKTAKPGKAAGLEAQLIALETGTWEAAKRHDVKAFAEVCLDDCIEIWGDGTVLTIKEVLDEVPNMVYADYKLEDFKVTFPAKTTALVRYRSWYQATDKGQPLPAQWVLSTAVWVKKGDAWKAAFYQETPAPKK